MALSQIMGQVCVFVVVFLLVARNRQLKANLDWREVQLHATALELADAQARLQSLLAAAPGPRRQAVEDLIARRQAGEAYPEDIDRVLLRLVDRIEELEGGHG